MPTIWVVTRKAHKKVRRKVVEFGKVVKSAHGFTASPKNPVEIALIEWGMLVEWQRKQSSPAYQGMLYDIAVKTKTRGWVGTGASMGFPYGATKHRFDMLTKA